MINQLIDHPQLSPMNMSLLVSIENVANGSILPIEGQRTWVNADCSLTNNRKHFAHFEIEGLGPLTVGAPSAD